MLRFLCIVICLLSRKGYAASLEQRNNDSSSHSAGDVVMAGSCGLASKYQLFEIRFDNNERPPIQICYNPTTYTTLWTNHEIDGPDLAQGGGTNGPQTWTHDQLFPAINVDDSYPMAAQVVALDNLLAVVPGVQPVKGGNYYIGDASNRLFMAKGHLTPNADFRLANHRETTYHYINAVPQWQINNQMSWASLEDAVREFAMANAAKMEVYTGTHGVTQLRNDNDNLVEVWLGDNKGTGEPDYNFLPAPRMMWKCFQLPTTNEIFLFIMNNNPYEQLINDINTSACPNTCNYGENFDNRPAWVNWDTMHYQYGYMHCCKVQSCSQVQQAIPGYEGGLTVNNI